MKHSEFQIGETFWCGEKPWRCTDIGTRTIVAIALGDRTILRTSIERGKERVSTEIVLSGAEAASDGWFNGPPYAVAEMVFDEHGIAGCLPQSAYYRNSRGNLQLKEEYINVSDIPPLKHPMILHRGPYEDFLKKRRAEKARANQEASEAGSDPRLQAGGDQTQEEE